MRETWMPMRKDDDDNGLKARLIKLRLKEYERNCE
jgi:hypothetical protein